MEDTLPFSTGKDDAPSPSQTGVFCGIGRASSSLLAQSIVVSETATDVRISPEIPTPSTDAENPGEGAHRRFLSHLGPTCLGFLRRCFVKKYGLLVASYLIRDLRESSIRQYETAWMALIRYVRLKKLSSFTEKIILEFFIWLYDKCRLQPNTIVSYQSALVKPLSVGLNMVITAERFAELSTAFLMFDHHHTGSNRNGALIKL